MFYAVSAHKNHVICGGDATNAFGEAPGPAQQYCIQPDLQFKKWWSECLGRPPLRPGDIIPILGNMQGHPEAPRQWAKHIHKIILSLGFKATAHEKYLYVGQVAGQTVYLMRQVDDFAVSAPDVATANLVLS